MNLTDLPLGLRQCINIFSMETFKIQTFDIVLLSGSSTGSAQSTITSQFHTFDRPEDNFRFAVEADL